MKERLSSLESTDYLVFEIENFDEALLPRLKDAYNRSRQERKANQTLSCKNESNSCLLWLLGITDVYDPRFRVNYEVHGSGPDIDTDFAPSGRPKLFKKIQETYGFDKVAKIGTITPWALKVSVVDFTKIVQTRDEKGEPVFAEDYKGDLIPVYGTHIEGQELADKIPDAVRGRATTWEALSSDPFYASLIKSNREVFDLAGTLDGLPKQNGIHPCGILISPEPLSNHIPVRHVEDDDDKFLVAEWEGSPLEKTCHYIKYDILSIDNLDLNQAVCDQIQKPLSWLEEEIPFDDEETFDFILKGYTSGMFQIEESHVLTVIDQVNPRSVQDLALISALIRPGPRDAGLTQDFITYRKTGVFQNKLHKSLDNVLAETGGVLVYQEQVMAACQILAGVSLATADDIRRAMGKKDKKLMDHYKQIFVDGAAKLHGIVEAEALRIWSNIETFADYGFNKAHALAYGVLSYQNAYLKTHYTREFMIALMTIRATKPDKLKKYINETRQMGISIGPPDINVSNLGFSVHPFKNSITFGLAAIHGIGGVVAAKIIESRSSKPFTDIWDFMRRIDRSKVNSRSIDILAKCGAFDCFGFDREYLVESVHLINKFLSDYEDYTESVSKVAARNIEIEEWQVNIDRWELLNKAKLVTKGKDENGKVVYDPPRPKKPVIMKEREKPVMPELTPMTFSSKMKVTKQMIEWEGRYCNFFISRHPLDFVQIPDNIEYNMLDDIDRAHANSGRTVAAIIGIEEIKIKNGANKGKLMAKLSIEDRAGFAELVLFTKQYEDPKLKDKLSVGSVIYFPYAVSEINGDIVRLRCSGQIKVVS